MPLISIWRDKPEEVITWSVRQVIMLAGDGDLIDGSECSSEFRRFLSEVEADVLARYVVECLEPSERGSRKNKRGFESSGFVLQDVVNEIGRRLDYTVDNGVYSGRVGAIGYDGIWRDGLGASLIVEVKTTDTYTISLDTIARYRQRLIVENTVEEASSVLFVVGRDDTGALSVRHSVPVGLIIAPITLGYGNSSSNSAICRLKPRAAAFGQPRTRHRRNCFSNV